MNLKLEDLAPETDVKTEYSVVGWITGNFKIRGFKEAVFLDPVMLDENRKEEYFIILESEGEVDGKIIYVKYYFFRDSFPPSFCIKKVI